MAREGRTGGEWLFGLTDGSGYGLAGGAMIGLADASGYGFGRSGPLRRWQPLVALPHRFENLMP